MFCKTLKSSNSLRSRHSADLKGIINLKLLVDLRLIRVVRPRPGTKYKLETLTRIKYSFLRHERLAHLLDISRELIEVPFHPCQSLDMFDISILDFLAAEAKVYKGWPTGK